MHIRDRIKELRRVRAGDLRPSPKNWRTHPAAQRDALRSVLAEVGYADALLARELPADASGGGGGSGGLELIDGHLRAETTPDALVPVLVLDVNEAEAAKLLATLDPLAAMAGTDAARLDDLLNEVQTESAALGRMLGELAGGEGGGDAEKEPERPSSIPELFQVVAECDDEAQQRGLYERLAAEGFKCRVVTL